MTNETEEVFEAASRAFLKKQAGNIAFGISERNLCGALMLELRKVLDKSIYRNYYVDVEYNRNVGGRLKTYLNNDYIPVNITCDLIVHSRGENMEQDNLIAIEMKRSNRPVNERDADRTRLKCLTKDSFNDVWSFDGVAHPEHVCRYVLGVYFEINTGAREALLEYYAKGALIKKYSSPF